MLRVHEFSHLPHHRETFKLCRKTEEMRIEKVSVFVVVTAIVCCQKGRADNCTDPTFGPVSYYGSELVGSEYIASGDFNGDGKPDLVTSNRGENSASVFIGNGDGTFQSPVSYQVGANPEGVAVGDLNGDKKLDFVVVNEFVSTSIFLGNGDGTFREIGLYPHGGVFAALADVNGDQKLDLVTESGTALGNGDGTFKDPIGYSAGPLPVAVAVGDFNRDGKPDLAIADYSFGGHVYVLLGNGDGTFQSATTYSSGRSSHSVATGDFNGDGKLDLTLPNQADNTVSVLLGNGDGAFGAATNYATGSNPHSVVAADFNNDGKVDLAVAGNDIGATAFGVSILSGNGDGSFRGAVTYNSPQSSFAIVAADFNRDGSLDLATPFAQVGVLLNACSQRPPGLGIHTRTNGLNVSWANSVNAYVLKSTTNLSSANWQAVVQNPVTNNAFLEVTVPTAGATRYFQLLSP